MESLEAYLDRKYQELELLNGFLGSPLPLRHPVTPDEVISQKFHIAAAMKAEHTLHDWALTETAWAHPGRLRAGPFEFSYDYQRADLEVRGPSFYDFSRFPAAHETVYTASGMAAISALLFASVRLFSEADILVLPGSYGETLELIESHVRHLRTVELKRSPDEVVGSARRRRILLFDSYVPAAAYETVLACAQPRLDLAVFDTTCFAAGSGRIRRFLSWAERWQIPVVLVRSHTKLDSLGVEYGRLGSAVFVVGNGLPLAKRQRMKELADEMRNAVRLFGGAALPAHFPPYVGSNSYRGLTDKRIAAILRNSRRTARYFASALPGSTAELHFAHGLYVTLASDRLVDERHAREAAAELARDLSSAGLPVRHAGSFGFDFGATEWFFHHVGNRYAVRIAVADLPTALWDKIARAVVQWWLQYDRQRSRAEPMTLSS